MSLLSDVERLIGEFEVMEFDCAEMAGAARKEGDDAKAARWNMARIMLGHVVGRLQGTTAAHWKAQ